MPSRIAAHRGPLALAALVLASTAARAALSRDVLAPWIAPDEQLYALLGRSLLSGEGLTLLGEPVPFYSLLYPLFVGVPFALLDLADAVRAVQLLQAAAMSLAAVPVYLWARPLAGRSWALAAAALAVLIPGLAYSGLVMSEALYYPVATLAVWALAACLARPTLARQALFLGALALALGTRVQAVGFVPALLAALALLAVAERSGAPFRRLLPTLGVLAAGALLWTASRIAAGGPGELLGAYAVLGEAEEYSLPDIAQAVAWQAGAVALVTVGVPLVALGLLAWRTARGAERDPRVRALAASGLAYAAVTLVEVGAFASRFIEHVTERQLLSVAPPAFVALAVWLHRGAPRPQPAASLVALAVAAAALLLPLDRATTPAAYADAPSFIPLERLRRELGQAELEGLYAGGLAVVLLAAVLLPRRAAPALAVAVAVALAAGSLAASSEIRRGTHAERERTFDGLSPTWIDDAGVGEATLLVSGDRLWPGVWEHLFWNSAITRVARLRGVESPGLIPQVVVRPRPDGRLVTSEGRELSPPYAVAPSQLSLLGEEVVRMPSSSDQPGLVLWRVERPLTLSLRVRGLRPNGDLHGGEAARITVYACGPGRLELTLLGKEPRLVRVLREGEEAAARVLAPREVWRPSVPAPAGADGRGTCVFEVRSDGLLGSTRIEFVRA